MSIGDEVHWRTLLDAVVAVNADLDLGVVLTEIVSAACAVSGARYGALGVLDPRTRELHQFLTYGLSPDERQAIGSLPSGRGVLGALIDDPRPLRLDDLATHPLSVGFPPHHPPMVSFLGVPIRVGDHVFGNLYLTDKQGGGDFDESDEALVVALAAAAGIAVEKAELYGSSRRRERWLAAAAEITTAFLTETPRPEVLRLLAVRAREVADADVAAILLGDASELVVEVVERASSPGAEGAPLPGHEGVAAWEAGDSLEVRGPLVSLMSGGDAQLVDGADWGAEAGIAAALLAPMRSSSGVSGILVLGRAAEADQFGSEEEAATAANFAEQAALALELARGQTDRARLAVYEDRDRIARDLHDLVVQRLFAVGLSLRTMTQRTLPDGEQVRRVSQAVDDLDETVKELRRSIFQLHQRPGEGNVRADLEGVVAAARTSLGFMPSLEVTGPIEDVPVVAVPPALAVLREALSNAARHAAASAVQVSVVFDLDERRLLLSVVDDGIGFAPGGHRGGLDNMRRRAEALGGGCDIEPRTPTGTAVTWWAPIPEE